MGFEDFEPIFGEPKPEWWKNSVSGSPPPRRFMLHVYAPDYYHLKIQVTDFHSNTFAAVKSVVQLEDLRDSMGIGGSWSDFVDYLIASVKSDNVELVLEKYSDSDDAANAKFFAQKSKGMPLIHISLAKLQNTAASDAMSEISFGLFKAYKSNQSSVSREKEHSQQLMTLVSAEKDKSENIQSQLEERLESSDKQDVSASLASNGLQGSPGVGGIPIPSNDPKNLDRASRTNQENCTVESGCFTNSQSVSYSTQPKFENIVLQLEEPIAEIVDKRQPWSIDEEKKLVSAWLTVSNNRTEGTGQIDRTIWKQVTEYLNANRRTSPPRKPRSVKNHWFWMLPLVNEFHQLYNKLLEECRNGSSDDQLKQRARELYYQNRKKHFLYEHVWVMLKDHLKRKINTPLPNSSKKTKINESGDYTSSSNADTSLEVDDTEVEVCAITQKADKTKERSENIQSQLEKRLKSSDKQDVSASLASNGLQGSPEPDNEHINLSQEPNEEVGDKRQPWSMEDDKRLVKAWLKISSDSIVGNGQTDRQFWKRVVGYYNEYRRSSAERKASTCKNHWFWMLPMIKGFNQLYNNLLSEYHSVWSDDQLKERAQELYYQNHKKRFNYEHVWLILKNDPKWKTNAHLSTSSKRAKTNENGVYTSSSNVETNDDEMCHIRQKTSKAKTKRKGKAKETAKLGAKEWHEVWSDFNKRQDEKIALAQSMRDAWDKKIDYEIFTRDTSSMTTKQLEHHRKFCDAMKVKWGIE